MVMESYQRGLLQKGMFEVIYDGLPTNLVKSFKVPDYEKEIMKFGSAGTFWDHKEPGRLIVGSFELEKGVPSDENDLWAWNLFIRDIYTPSVERKNLIVRTLKMDRVTPLHEWEIIAPIFSKIPGIELDGMSSDPVLQKVIGECDYMNFKKL